VPLKKKTDYAVSAAVFQSGGRRRRVVKTNKTCGFGNKNNVQDFYPDDPVKDQ
jgi:hypothetical protein